MKKSILAILIILSIGCTHDFFGYKASGDRNWQYAIETLPDTPNLNKTIHLVDVTVHIVGNRSQFEWPIASSANSGVVGYATTGNEIWVFGRAVNGKIVLNQAVLGHELSHLLNFTDPDVANPDKLEEVFE